MHRCAKNLPFAENSFCQAMPHSMPPLWGGSKKPRHCYTSRMKLAALVLIGCYMAEDGVSQTEAAGRANISCQNIERWMKHQSKFLELWGRDSQKKSSNNGPNSQLNPIKDELLL